MPLTRVSPSVEKIPIRLVQDMEAARARYAAGEGTIDEYTEALLRLNDFIVTRTLPPDLPIPVRRGDG